MKKVICIHVYNGFTGSPNVLATVINGLVEENYDVTLVTSLNNKGFLSNINCTKKNIHYVFKVNKIFRLFQFLKFQLFSGIFVLRSNKNDVIYLNTIQPFFSAIIARSIGRKVIFHVHESYPKKSIFTKFLFYTIYKTANKIICVSDFVFNQLDVKSQRKAFVIQNTVSHDFFENKIETKTSPLFNKILMVSSAREYKGVFEFCKLADILKEYNFTLICDASNVEILELFKDYMSIPNLRILETKENLHKFYNESDLIVNLSIPNQIIETFGLTILEGMFYGLPCIVPPVGGITELVTDGVNGYKVDSRQTSELIQKIRFILNDNNTYNRMSEASINNSKNFSKEEFIRKIIQVID